MATVLIRLLATVVLVSFSFTLRAETVPGPVPPDTLLVEDAALTVTEKDYRQALLGLPKQQRPGIERNPETVREFLLELYIERRLVEEARRLGLLDKPEIVAQLEVMQRKILVSAVIDQFKAGLKAPDFTDLAQEYYLTHRQDYLIPERVRVAHILLQRKCPCEDQNGQKRKQAEAILTELKNGANFIDLAQKYSEDVATAKLGGALEDLLTREKLVKPFADAAFALSEPGDLSGVVETEYGYHIIRLLEHQPEIVLPFDSVKGRIIEKLASEFDSINRKEFIAKFYPKPESFKQVGIDALVKPLPAEAPPPAPSPTK